jgi:hypothetical protein
MRMVSINPLLRRLPLSLLLQHRRRLSCISQRAPPSSGLCLYGIRLNFGLNCEIFAYSGPLLLAYDIALSVQHIDI